MSVIRVERRMPGHDDVAFVCEAINKKDARRYMHTILVNEDGRMYGCDGYRLHSVRPDVLRAPPDVYDVEGTKTNILLIKIEDPASVQWPSEASLLKILSPPAGRVRVVEFHRPMREERGGLFYCVSRLGPFMNLAQLNTLESYSDTWRITCSDDPKSGVLFESSGKQALIMPQKWNPWPEEEEAADTTENTKPAQQDDATPKRTPGAY